jgi:uncharacterized DUF497 family protein
MKRRTSGNTAGYHFELASLVFEDERCLLYIDCVDDYGGEQRWIALGMTQPAADAVTLLVVAHVYREDKHGEEFIRIISARQAEKREVRRYQALALDES